MRIASRAALRLALTGCLGLAGMSIAAAPSLAAAPPEKVFPDSTLLFVKVANASAMREAFRQSQFGQLWNDPAMKDFRTDVAEKLNEGNKSFKEKFGVTLAELVELPQGPTAMGLTAREDDKTPTLMLIVDAGKNTKTLTDVLTKATKEAEDGGAKIEEQKFKNQSLTTIIFPKKEDKEKEKGDKEQDAPPPLTWTHNDNIFTIGTSVDAVKDLVANADGRDGSLADNANFQQVQKKCGSEAQAFWYIDFNRVIKLALQASASGRGNAAQAQQAEAIFQVVGINGLKAIGGSFALTVGNYDSLSKTVFLAPAPAQGVLKVFQLPKVELKPEAWVPATVSTYQTISWDLDGAFTAINDLANMFQPGLLNVLEQQLVGPNGGEPLSFQKDVFGPLGDRITILTDFKKPISEDSQRNVLAVALEDPKKAEDSFKKLVETLNASPKKREFQGTTIFDFEVGELPNANGQNMKLKGPISLAFAKNMLFVASDSSLLEQLLRGGGTPLAESSAYQAVAKEFPDKACTLSFARPEESARISYDLLKSGQFEKALQQAAVAGGNNAPKLDNVIDKNKLPDFSVFAKYLSPGGSYSLSDDDGLVMTSFTLRKQKP
ncbi:MAG: hypothetical protein P4L84_21665 [Isosphaeraceae bacterium]|nr:hypothetical protein [Isosphaeraceae bacterium]